MSRRIKALPGEAHRIIRARLARDLDDECWRWPFGHSDGYGIMWHDGRPQRVHRVVLEMTQGPAPEGAVARHLCGNGRLGCWNPNHLAYGTPSENNADALEHGKVGNRATPDEVRQIRRLRAEGLSFNEIRLAMGQRFSPSTIQRIAKRETWAHIPEAAS